MKALKVLAMISFVAVSAFSAITNSKHDLSFASTTSSGLQATSATNEICVFCHTPHGANTSFAGAPLWNKANISTSDTSWKVYGASTTNAAGATIGATVVSAIPSNPSKACLSCHDGASAINSIVNAPGSGGYNSGGANVAFDNNGTPVTAGTAFTMPSGITQIGSDLSNDHPISVTYDVGADGTTGTPGSLKDPTTALAGWVTPGGLGTINSLLKSGKVECSSCHDPHLGEATTFLRVANTGSALCLGCHNK